MFFTWHHIFNSLNTNQILNFGDIKWTPAVDFTGSFLDILIVQYVRQGLGKKLPPKMQNKFVFASFDSLISPIVSCPFCEKQESGVWNKGIYRILFCILLISYVKIILEAMLSRVFPTHLYHVEFQLVKKIVSGCVSGLPHVYGKTGM